MATQVGTPTRSSRLTTALRSDGVFAFLSGIITLAGARPIASLIDLEAPWILAGLGVVLIGYGGLLLYYAGREPQNEQVARAAVVLNALWVLGSYVGLLFGLFALNSTGKWAVALVAEAVALFAIWEFIALRRLARER